MATTIARLADEILLLLSGGRVGNATKWHPTEIKLSICQVANQLLKVEYFSQLTPLQEFIPSGAAMATYENNLVVPWSNTSKTTLPAMPIRLPRNLGVQVFDQTNFFTEFIPLQRGEIGMIQSQGLVGALSGFIGYEVNGLDVIFTEDLTIPNTNIYVTIRLVVLDFTQYSDYDPLPLPPEMEWPLKKEIYQLYMNEEIPDKLVDPGVKEQGKTPVPQQRQT
jgi:hypothetical protein